MHALICGLIAMQIQATITILNGLKKTKKYKIGKKNVGKKLVK